MFRSFIYLDKDKFYTYKRQLEGNNNPLPKTISQKRGSNLSASAGAIGFNGVTEMNISAEYEQDVSFDYDIFEQLLSTIEGEDYFDFVINPEYDLSTIPAMKLIRICNSFFIPEEFDMVNLLEKFMPMLMGQISTNSVEEKQTLEKLLGGASADIPFLVDESDIVISGRLNVKNLLEDRSEIEIYADQDAYMLCKVVGLSRKEKVEIFDPLKDFIKLPRVLRRELEKQGKVEGLDKIIVDGPVLKVEVIAIYK